MKYRNHARVRAATRAGEPVRPCARARSGSHASQPLTGEPAKSFNYLYLHPRGELSAKRDRSLLAASHVADEFLTFSFVAKTLGQKLEK